MRFAKSRFSRNHCFSIGKTDIFKVRGVHVGKKSIKHRSKKDFKMRRHLDIDFCTILLDFGKQVGFENPTKIDPRRHRKSNGKVDKKERPKMVLGGTWEGSSSLQPPPPGRLGPPPSPYQPRGPSPFADAYATLRLTLTQTNI